MKTPLTPDQLAGTDAYWRAANFLSVGQIYLRDNPLLTEKLTLAHVKPRLLGHWGTTPGLNLVYVHLNRVIKALDLNMIYVTGQGAFADFVSACLATHNAYIRQHGEDLPDTQLDVEGRSEPSEHSLRWHRHHSALSRAADGPANATDWAAFI